MNRFLRGVARSIAESFVLPEPILEVGSLQVDEGEDLINLRSFFAGRRYIGVDFRAGPGVDCVASVEELPQATGSIGTVISFSAFEHVQRFWLGFDEVHRVLRADGAFVVACPFYFHQHAYPSDYWRFTPHALEQLLDKYPTRIVGWHGPARREANVWAIGFREQAVLPTEQQFGMYRQLLGKYAREPLAWTRRLKYQIGRLLCGRRPFAPHLDREKWDTVLQRTTSSEIAAKAA